MRKFNLSGNIPNTDIYLEKVIYRKPATIAIWSDKTRTVSKCSKNDLYSEEVGLYVCFLKKIFGSTNLRTLRNDWLPYQESIFSSTSVTLKDVRALHR